MIKELRSSLNRTPLKDDAAITAAATLYGLYIEKLINENKKQTETTAAEMLTTFLIDPKVGLTRRIGKALGYNGLVLQRCGNTRYYCINKRNIEIVAQELDDQGNNTLANKIRKYV